MKLMAFPGFLDPFLFMSFQKMTSNLMPFPISSEPLGLLFLTKVYRSIMRGWRDLLEVLSGPICLDVAPFMDPYGTCGTWVGMGPEGSYCTHLFSSKWRLCLNQKLCSRNKSFPFEALSPHVIVEGFVERNNLHFYTFLHVNSALSFTAKKERFRSILLSSI